MKRALALLLFGFVAIWAAALLDVRGTPHASSARAPQAEALSAAQASVAPHAAPTPASPEPEPEPTAEPSTTPPAPAQVSPTGAIARAKSGMALIGKAAHSLLTNAQPEAAQTAKPLRNAKKPEPVATGELGEGVLSPEFAESEQRYAAETRDGDWAPALEDRVHALLKGQTWADNVGVVHCQQTLCRIVIETDVGAQNPFDQLLAVPGMREETGLGPDTPYSLRSGQFSVYFRGRAPAAL